MKLRVRCGSKCGGSQPRTRRIPPRLAGPTSPARSDAGLKRGSQAPPAIPLFSRSRRLSSGPVRGVLFRLCIGDCRSASIPHPVTRRRRNASTDSIRYTSGGVLVRRCVQRLSTSAPRTLTLRPVATISNHERGPRDHGRLTSRSSPPLPAALGCCRRAYHDTARGIDAVSVLDAWGLELPGFAGMKLGPTAGPGMGLDVGPGQRSPFLHFRDSNVTLARLPVPAADPTRRSRPRRRRRGGGARPLHEARRAWAGASPPQQLVVRGSTRSAQMASACGTAGPSSRPADPTAAGVRARREGVSRPRE